MGSQQVKPNINQQQYGHKFSQVSKDCQQGPSQNRSCRDICCLVTFILLSLFLLVVGIYFIASFDKADLQRLQSYGTNKPPSTHQHFLLKSHPNHLIDSHFQTSTTTSTTKSDFPDFAPALPYIILMCILGLIISIVIILLISKNPKCMVKTLTILTIVLLVIGIIVGIVLNFLPLIIIAAIFTFIWLIMFCIVYCCFKEQMETALVLLKVTSRFIRHKPTVLLTPLFVLLVSGVFFLFWGGSFIAIQADRPWDKQYGQTAAGSQAKAHFEIHDILSIIWIVLSLIFTYFFYYIMVFIISIATAFWYYDIQHGNYLISAIKYILKAHIGSLTFASLIVSIVKLLKSAAQPNDSGDQNLCSIICICFVKCCLQLIEQFIKVLNHHAVIVMSFTGQNFVNSAKSAMYLIYQNFGVFVAIDLVNFILTSCIIVFVVFIPSILGLVLLKSTYDLAETEEEIYLTICVVIILLVCLLISILLVTIISESLSCIFIFYCMDKKFHELNYNITNRVPQQLRELFNQIQNEQKHIENHDFYKESQQLPS